MKYDTLFGKALWWSVDGVVAIIASDIVLPGLVIWCFISPGTFFAVAVAAVCWVIGVALLTAVILFGAISLVTLTATTDSERADLLWKIIAKGRDMMFRWSLVGIAFFAFCLIRYALRTLRPRDEGLTNGD